MALTDTMFFFEIMVEELKTFVNCSEFSIKGEFADVFSVNLKDPNKPKEQFSSKCIRPIKKKRKAKIRKSVDKVSTAPTVQLGQTVLFAINVDTLISNMKQYPLELSLWSKDVPDYRIGSSRIPWTAPYFEYLNKLHTQQGHEPICIRGDYAIFKEATSKRMAIIRLSVTLRHFKDIITAQYRSPSPVNRQTEMNTPLNSEPGSVLSTKVKDRPVNFTEETGITKTTTKVDRTVNRRLNIHLVRTETSLNNKNPSLTVIKSKSYSTIVQKISLDILNDNIFGAGAGLFGNQVYCVNYLTVENDMADPSSPKSPSGNAGPSSPKTPSGNTSGKSETSGIGSEEEKEKDRYKFRICKSDCAIAPHSRRQSTCSLDLSKKAAALITVKKCSDVACTFEKMREVPTPPDDRILIDLSSRRPDCCLTEEMVARMQAKVTFGSHPCYCECECQFGFMKKTTFCTICGGFEKFGEDYGKVPGFELPYPCPIYHKINSSFSKEESDSKKKAKPIPSDDGETSSKKGNKKKTDDRFKFKYGFTGIPAEIGHSCCALPCVGTLGAVPKNMGWLWTCQNVPGMKFRPLYKPGAVNKHVLRLLKIAKNPEEVLSKKKRKDEKPKRPVKRPLLIVHKKDGEYKVTMETMRTFAKTRTYNQQPFEDKPVVTYTIGRTSEENLQRRIKKERAKRRLERLQRDFVQSAFRDMCQDICQKTYQQALELLPDAEKLDCSCLPALPGPDDVDLDHSCSCDEDKTLSESDTDSDEWIVEFTPPTAKFDPSFKIKKLLTANSATQYTYLDYKVKLLDRSGNPVPRFFKGPNGKQQCSDLGGFWSADGKWLEINVDGFIGPDERWAPHQFLGPNDEQVDGEAGKFQAMNGKWLIIGVDGYIEQGKWKYYAKPKSPPTKKRKTLKKPRSGRERTKEEPEETWSCFGSVTPKQLSKMGIMGHGHDRKLLYTKLKDLKARGEDVHFPEPSIVPRSKSRKGKRGTSQTRSYSPSRECKHATPSDKGIVGIDRDGNKKYFRKKESSNKRPQDRMSSVTGQRISVSPFHVPCYESFMGSEEMKKRQYDRLVAMAEGRGGSGSLRGRGRSTRAVDYSGVYGNY